MICVGHVELRGEFSGNVQTYMHGLHSAEGGDRVLTERRYTPNSKLEFYRRESHTTALAGYRGRSRAERVDSPSAHARESTRSVCCQQCRGRNTGRLSVEPAGGVLCAVCERHPPPPGATCGRESPGGKTCKMQTRRCHRSLQVLSPQGPPHRPRAIPAQTCNPVLGAARSSERELRCQKKWRLLRLTSSCAV